MLRGFRWQLLALVISIILFSVVIGLRFLTPDAVIEVTPTATSLPPTMTVAPTFTPQPTAIIAESQISEPTITTINEGIVGTIQRLNPLLITTQAERDVNSLIFEGLVTINEFGEPSPELALDWVVSRDGYEYVVQLRQDVLWQDGIPFTADDVIFTYQLLADLDFPLTEMSAFWQTVEIEKLGDYLIRFRLAQPLASFPTLLRDGILPQHALVGTTASQLANHPFNLTPIGTGAYQLANLRSSNGQQIDAVDLQLAPTYRQRVEGQDGYAIEALQIRLFSSFDGALSAFVDGSIQSLASSRMSNRPSLLGLGTANIYTQIEPTVGMLIFNWDEGDETRFFTDLRVRRGLQLGLNRNNPVELSLLNQAVVADTPLHPDSWAYNAQFGYPSPDPAQAFNLFENAIITVPEDVDLGEARYRFSILTPDDPALVALANNIAGQWSQFNLDVLVEAVNQDSYVDRLANGDFDTAIVEYIIGADPDSFAYWHADQHDAGFNYGRVTDTRISEILERGRQTTSNLSRIDIYRNFQVEFSNQVIAIPLYYPLYSYAVSQTIDGVQLGFISSPEDRFRTLKDWTISNE